MTSRQRLPGVVSSLNQSPSARERLGHDRREANPACAGEVTPEQAAEAARVTRLLMRDKSYRAFPLGQEAGRYMREKRKRFTTDTYRDYESCLDKLARHFCDLELRAFEPPQGTELLEEFLDHQWGHREPRTYNKNHSILNEFFKFYALRGELKGNPMLLIERAKPRGVHRETFTADQRLQILAANPEPPDSAALRLLLTYGLRKGTLRSVQYSHFDFGRRRLTTFVKGGKVQSVPIPDPAFWADLDVHMRQTDAQPRDYLLCRRKTHPVKFDRNRKPVEYGVRLWRDEPMGVHGLHDWWYQRLAAAAIVPVGTTSGERMHKARHTAGQRVLDKTGGNLKAVQKLLGHADISTTGNIYTDWDIDQLTETLEAIGDE
jgi:integrase